MSGRITHYKIVLLGDTAVGKSCLVVRFVRNEFSDVEQVFIFDFCDHLNLIFNPIFIYFDLNNYHFSLLSELHS